MLNDTLHKRAEQAKIKYAKTEPKNYTLIKYVQKGKHIIELKNLSIEECRYILDTYESSSHTASEACNHDERKILSWDKSEKHWFYGFTSEPVAGDKRFTHNK